MQISKEVLMFLPNVAILVARLAGDKRIPTESKMTLAAAAAYFVMPLDLLPDFIPGLGQVDDAIALLLVIDGVVNHLDQEIVREHWRGDPATLQKIQRYSAMLTRFVPKRFKEKLFNRRLSGAAMNVANRFRSAKPNAAQTSA
jgi:uncharacterized membrane protein YkvA (DUF1232 family)